MIFNKFVSGGGGGVAERQGAQCEGQLGAAGGNSRPGARQEEGGAAAGEAAQLRPVRRGGTVTGLLTSQVFMISIRPFINIKCIFVIYHNNSSSINCLSH